jgi:hypothetical protein
MDIVKDDATDSQGSRAFEMARQKRLVGPNCSFNPFRPLLFVDSGGVPRVGSLSDMRVIEEWIAT